MWRSTSIVILSTFLFPGTGEIGAMLGVLLAVVTKAIDEWEAERNEQR